MNRPFESAACALVLVAALAGGVGAEAGRARVDARPSKIDNTTRCDANNLDFIVTNHGSLMLDLVNGTSGLTYPKGTSKTSVFAAGLWLGAKVNDQLRVTVGEYSQEFVPGPMADGAAQPDNPRFRVYKIVRGDTTSADYREWPVEDGAPVDSLGRPALVGDVTLWCVYNDADPSVHLNDAGKSAPLGIEVQQCVFAFNQQNPLGDCAFMQFRLINKGSNVLDSMYVSFWSDPDLGEAGDDLAGCDTARSLGYAYNATNGDAQYGATPPAVGFDFFQGPWVPGDENDPQGRRLPMTSFNRYVNGTDPRSAMQSYHYMLGLNADGTPYEDPDGQPTPYQLAGDPVLGEGDIDENPSDRRFQLSSGPFRMAPGDSQEIVVGVVVGQGANRLSSIRVLQANDEFAQAAYDLGFDIASPPPSPTLRARAFNRSIDLVWDGAAETSVSTNARLGQEYRFQGYNLYQSLSIGGPWVRFATFDIADSLGVIYDDVFSPETGAYERLVVQKGPNEGLTHHMVITTDALRGGRLVSNREYFFAVSAYSVDVNHTTPFEVGGAVVGHLSPYPLESGLRVTRVIPRGSSAVLTDEADHTAGASDGQVMLEYLDPKAVERKDYRVTFAQGVAGPLTWSLIEEGVTSKTILEGQTKFDGDYTYPIVNGIMVRVIAPPVGAKRLVEVCPDGTETDILHAVEAGNCTREWYVDPTVGTHTIEFLNRFEPLYNADHDYEVRFVEGATESAWDFFGREDFYSGRFGAGVPWEVWDIGAGTPDDPSDDVRISAMVLDEGDGAWGWGDGIYLRNIPYGDVDWSAPDLSSGTYDPDDVMLGYGRLFFFRVDETTDGPLPAAGTRVRLATNKPITPVDVFTFRSSAPGTAEGTVLTTESRITPIPNPYYNRSSYELNQFDRVVRFSSLPPRKVTIRIFSLAGDLVRTLSRDDATEGIVDWDLLTDRGLTVGSGIYFWVADVEGSRTQRGKLAVFVEKERLNTF
jgi:hypothetical protein